MQRSPNRTLARTLAKSLLALAFACAFVSSLAMPPTASAQAQKQRTVDGTVRNAAGQPMAGAVVYLKNATTLSVKTYVTTADGGYRFGQVPMDADYQVYAESSGKKSQTKTISNFDSKQLWTIGLKIDK